MHIKTPLDGLDGDEYNLDMERFNRQKLINILCLLNNYIVPRHC